MTTHHLLRDSLPPSKAILQEWLDRQGIIRDAHLEIAEMDDGQSWRLVTRRDMYLGELVCAIPKTSILSHRTSALRPLPSDNSSGPSNLNGHTILHLSLCLLHEFRLGEESPFYGYLQSLPRETIPLPVFWNVPEIGGEDGKSARRWLEGTEAERELRIRDRDGLSLIDIQAFYQTYSSHLPPTSTHPAPSSILSFYYCFSLVSTRAFMIDIYHLIALCPFADILNHSSIHANTSLSSDDFVCHSCGSLKTCKHDITDSQGIAYRLHHLARRDINRIEEDIDTIELRVESPIVQSGKEVWNSYGDAIGDGKLLVEWGFISQEFAGEGLIWELDDLTLSYRRSRAEEEDEQEEQRIWELIDRAAKVLTIGIIHGSYRELDDGDSESEEDEKLLCGQSKVDARLLNLDQSGRISINMVGWAWFCITDEGSSASTQWTKKANSEEGRIASENLISAIKSLERLWTHLSREEDDDDQDSAIPNDPAVDAPPSVLVNIVERISLLLRARLHKMYRSNKSEDELFDLRDSLDPEDNLQYMAMTISINERVLLRSALSRWDALSGYLH
ncbi:uncharacterized protein I303_103644 [Kwoniella dejecticola CBS 10117]|uniref:Uncharacterized protein n=1 Tax=Kwoniella dejecticola CBS 10117 TaxID=1296121 RepID=A0A1A6A7B5_9TREE|nr:uncharacterized protein I303_03665 [Kwoniella dejecticola CBS 10117]OBR85950.1 hypothetical protein I303_03665 [Kwoniella dejecticola CBS 10117]